jgi:hypothetical protein
MNQRSEETTVAVMKFASKSNKNQCEALEPYVLHEFSCLETFDVGSLLARFVFDNFPIFYNQREAGVNV